MMSTSLVVCLMTVFNIAISRNSIENCRGVQEPGKSRQNNGQPDTFVPYNAYQTASPQPLTNAAVIIPSNTYAIDKCNWDIGRDPDYSWKYECNSINELKMSVYVGTKTCDSTAQNTNTFTYTFDNQQREFNCDPTAADCSLKQIWGGFSGTNKTNCAPVPASSYANTYVVSGGCAPDYTQWGGGVANLYVSVSCNTANPNSFYFGWYTDDDCTSFFDVNQQGMTSPNPIIKGACNGPGAGVVDFICNDDSISTTMPAVTNIYCGGGNNEYYCADVSGPWTCGQNTPGECDQGNPIYCQDDSQCENEMGFDYCQFSYFCVPNCNNLQDGDTFCKSYGSDDFICKDNGRCGHEPCNNEGKTSSEGECQKSGAGFVCVYKWDGNANTLGCIRDCRQQSNSDAWCATEEDIDTPTPTPTPDTSYKCRQDTGECERDECDTENGNPCQDSSLVCDDDREECIMSCNGDDSLCQSWENGPDLQYYKCNFNNICEYEYPVCSQDSDCDGLTSKTGKGFLCSNEATRTCYEKQCDDDNDCMQYQGPIAFCDTDFICKNRFEDQGCNQHSNCNWTQNIQFSPQQGYGLEWACVNGRCDKKPCTYSSQCSSGYYCVTYPNTNFCVENCSPYSNDCCNYFGCDSTSWQCDTNGECMGTSCTTLGNECLSVDSNAVCKCKDPNDCFCTIDECKSETVETDCPQSYFNDCHEDTESPNACFRNCAVTDDCDVVFGQGIQCEPTGDPTVKYCDIFETNYESCVIHGCNNAYGETCDIPTGNCEATSCTEDADCSSVDSSAVCKCKDNDLNCFCVIDECKSETDCTQSYYDDCYEDTEGPNFCIKKCYGVDKICDLDFGQRIKCAPTEPSVSYCDLGDNYDSCVIRGCDDNDEMCDIPTGRCIECKIDTDCDGGKLCNTSNNECEAQSCTDDDDCKDIDDEAQCKCDGNNCGCAVDACTTASDCTEPYFNACFVNPTKANECYRNCLVEDDCDAVFGQNVECKDGAPCDPQTDPGCEEVKYCDMFDIQSCVIDGCNSGEICYIPTGVCEVGTSDPPTPEPTEECENDDGDLEREGCEDDGCDVNEAYVTFELTFEVCTITPFRNKRREFWGGIADCFCEIGLGDDEFDGTAIDFESELDSSRRLLGRGSSKSKCDERVTKYRRNKIDYSKIDGCSSEYVDWSREFIFTVEGCGDCDKLKKLWEGYQDVTEAQVETKVEAYIITLGKLFDVDVDVAKKGFVQVEITDFKYEFIDGNNECGLDLDQSGVVSVKKFNSLLVFMLSSIMMYVLL